MKEITSIKTFAAIGSGVIGSGWVARALAHGLDVVAWDPAPGAEKQLRDNVANAWPALERIGLAQGASQERLRFVKTIEECVAQADFIQESAPERTASEPELTRFLESEWTLVPTVEEAFSALAMKDSQLRMMFSCCHSRLSKEAQIALILHILCGFSVKEIAQAFMSSHAAIEKRITRAKKILSESTKLFGLTDADFPSRLSSVLQALYLLFNEGYHGSSPEAAVRTDLCQEAMLLMNLLIEQPDLVTPQTYALAALMYLNAARLPTRLDGSGNLISFFDQDRSLWNHKLITEGQALLNLSASGTELTKYHIEAAIASMHTSAARSEDTDWKQIASLYDMLMAIHPSPVIALNRAIAIAQLEGPERGLQEIGVIHDLHRLSSYPFYPATLGELALRRGNYPLAKIHFSKALSLARSPMERNFLQRRIDTCKES